MFKKTIIPIMVLALASMSTLGTAEEATIDQEQSRKPEQEAQQAAEEWLKVIDNGDYAKSREQAASMFKEKISEEQWVQALSTGRDALGKVAERELKAVQFTTEIPDLPDGEYAIVQFACDYEAKKETTETVILIKEEDHVWRVAGYYMS